MSNSTPDQTHKLLICSVGGSPEPVAASIKYVQPARVLLWHSEDTRDHGIAARSNWRTMIKTTPTSGALRSRRTCSAAWRIRQRSTRMIALGSRSPQHRTVVDFTGGTKAMSAAMVLVAHRWDCQFLYIAGSARTKDGTGAVPIGSEAPVQQANPYDALAYQPLQDAVQLFNHGQAGAASQMLDSFTKRLDLSQAVKRQLIAVQNLTNAYAHWDAFRHKDAVSSFEMTIKVANDLGAAMPRHDLIPTLETHRDLCLNLVRSQGNPSHEFILDLLANADRRHAINASTMRPPGSTGPLKQSHN